MVAAVVIGLGAVFGAGLVIVVLGLWSRPPSLAGRVLRLRGHDPGRSFAIAVAGLATLVVTRWPVLAAAAAIATWWFTSRTQRSRLAAIERTEAIATWAEMLRDATSTPRGIEGVLVSTAATSPHPIRSDLMRLAHRASYEPLEVVLADLAEDLDDANGDLVVAALELAATSGGRDLRGVLDHVARAARDEARMRRRVDVSRERPRSDMRQVVAVIVAVIGLLALTSREYLAAYGNLAGQLVLCIAGALWVGGFAAMARLSRVGPQERFLTRREPG